MNVALLAVVTVTVSRTVGGLQCLGVPLRHRSHIDVRRLRSLPPCLVCVCVCVGTPPRTRIRSNSNPVAVFCRVPPGDLLKSAAS